MICSVNTWQMQRSFTKVAERGGKQSARATSRLRDGDVAGTRR